MKRLLLYIGIAAAILGCTKSEELSTSAADGAISFSAGEIATRVTDGGTTLSWESGESINITDGTKSAIYTISNTSTGAMQFYSGQEFYTYGDQTQTFYGWSPSSLTASEGKLSLDLSSQSAVSQVVVGKATTATTSATFAFAPIYTKVVFNLTAGGADVNDLSTATATLSGANVTGKYDYEAGTFSELIASDITPTVVVDSEDSSKATITAYVLETPSMSGELIISVGSDSFVSSLAGKSWAKGDMYEYNVTVGDDGWDGTTIATGFESGSGTSVDDPYIIANGAQLAYLAQQVTYGNSYSDTYFKLAGNINLNNYPWTAIGDYYNNFGGSFDGANFEISGVNAVKNGSYSGLFSIISSSGSVSNLGIVDSYFSANGINGSIAGENNGSITNCYNKGDVVGVNNGLVGGIVGWNNGTITNCYNIGDVTGGYDEVGGVAGFSSGSVTNCYNTGSVEGNNYTGGVVGHSLGSVTNCYNTGSVSGSSNVGGVVGYLEFSSVTNCYWLSSAFSGEGVGYNNGGTVEKVDSKSESDMTGGTFATTLGDAFKEDYSTPINNGYPILTWQ